MVGAILVPAALMLGVYTIVESNVCGLASAHTLELGAIAIALLVAFMPDTVAMAALSIGLSARLIVRFGARDVLLAGLTSIAAAQLLFTRSPLNASYVTDLLAPMILSGIGAGLAFTSLSILAMADATPSDSGLASGLLNRTTQVGAALGLAIFATLSSKRSEELIAQG